ncbi:hypothetical protein V8E53_012165 [Lactarius tabidus]
MDPNVVRERLALQMQIYALKNGGMVSDSTLSPSSTPFPGPQYNPWTFLQISNAFGGGRRGGIAESTAIMRSSPSHQPVTLPPLRRGNHGLRRREHSQDLRRRAKVRPPPHVESTQPRDTSPELSSGEESAGEFKAGEHSSDPQRYEPRPAHWGESADDEDDEDVEEWMVSQMTCFSLNFIRTMLGILALATVEAPLGALLRAFHALDRETDATLVFLAAPSQTGKLHSVASHAVRRDSSLHESTDMVCIRSAFAELAARRRASRSSSLLE